MFTRISKGNEQRAFEVDMSSQAIARRIREVGELNQLGLSLARAKPYVAPFFNTDQPWPEDRNSISEDGQADRGKKGQ